MVEADLVPNFLIAITVWTTAVLADDAVVFATVQEHFAVVKLAVPPKSTFLPADVLGLDRHIEGALGGEVLPRQRVRSSGIVVGRCKGDCRNDEACANGRPCD